MMAANNNVSQRARELVDETYPLSNYFFENIGNNYVSPNNESRLRRYEILSKRMHNERCERCEQNVQITRNKSPLYKKTRKQLKYNKIKTIKNPLLRLKEEMMIEPNYLPNIRRNLSRKQKQNRQSAYASKKKN